MTDLDAFIEWAASATVEELDHWLATGVQRNLGFTSRRADIVYRSNDGQHWEPLGARGPQGDPGPPPSSQPSKRFERIDRTARQVSVGLVGLGVTMGEFTLTNTPRPAALMLGFALLGLPLALR